MSLSAPSHESKLYLSIVVELRYLFESISYSFMLHKHYCVYLQWLLRPGSWKPQNTKRVFLILQNLRNICQTTPQPQSSEWRVLNMLTNSCADFANCSYCSAEMHLYFSARFNIDSSLSLQTIGLLFHTLSKTSPQTHMSRINGVQAEIIWLTERRDWSYPLFVLTTNHYTEQPSVTQLETKPFFPGI